MINFTQDEATTVIKTINDYYVAHKLPQGNGASIVRYSLNQGVNPNVATKFWAMVTMDKQSNVEELNQAVKQLLIACRTQTVPAWGYKGT